VTHPHSPKRATALSSEYHPHHTNPGEYIADAVSVSGVRSILHATSFISLNIYQTLIYFYIGDGSSTCQGTRGEDASQVHRPLSALPSNPPDDAMPPYGRANHVLIFPPPSRVLPSSAQLGSLPSRPTPSFSSSLTPAGPGPCPPRPRRCSRRTFHEHLRRRDHVCARQRPLARLNASSCPYHPRYISLSTPPAGRVGGSRFQMESYLNDNFGGVKPKHSSEEALGRWRDVVGVVKNHKRRFRFTANLSKRSEAAQMKRSNQVRAACATSSPLLSCSAPSVCPAVVPLFLAAPAAFPVPCLCKLG
jgi:hypothetical protein